jgi:hypothetical protein
MDKIKKQNTFLRVRNLLADELIINLRIQKIYGSLFEGSQLEREYIKLDTRYRNENHLNKVLPNRKNK